MPQRGLHGIGGQSEYQEEGRPRRPGLRTKTFYTLCLRDFLRGGTIEMPQTSPPRSRLKKPPRIRARPSLARTFSRFVFKVIHRFNRQALVRSPGWTAYAIIRSALCKAAIGAPPRR